MSTQDGILRTHPACDGMWSSQAKALRVCEAESGAQSETRAFGFTNFAVLIRKQTVRTSI